MSEAPPIQHLAHAIRALSMDAVQQAESGHPGMPMGMADVATVLFSRFLRFDAGDPTWPDRDRFILSAGHGSMLLYALLHLTGYEEATLEELKKFRQLGSKTAGHPEFGYCPGIETTTGPLGQGLANAVGFALAERWLNARYGDGLVDHHTYVIAGDGCLMEGISQEAISLAGHLKLNRLIVLFDDNAISIDGPTSLATSDDALARFRASGWSADRVDGHDPEAVAVAIEAARASDRPAVVACRTTIGYGAPNKAGTASAHGSPLGPEEIAGARAAYGWPHAPFEIPAPILETWREIGGRGREARIAWEARRDALPTEIRAAWDREQSGDMPEAALAAAVSAQKEKLFETRPKKATRAASLDALEVLTGVIPELVGGSADLTGSNKTRTKGMERAVTRDDYGARYIHYGVREHGMAAAMNGLALHGGIVPYGGTFLVFTDYCRPAIRLSALMHQRVIYVMSHDSIGLGEDGPTHQPIEHLASLRAMPGVQVFRPADAVETLECWQVALERRDRPSVIALSRQGLPALRVGQLASGSDNLCRGGAYVLKEPPAPRQVTLLATGSEVSIASDAAAALEAEGISAAVVSMPCWELFAERDRDAQTAVLGTVPRVSIEAGTTFGWERWTGPDGVRLGLDGFGASAPASDLYAHFGLTAARMAEAARTLVAAG
ncbi:MAG: transketolase [Myxococcota bacterium]